MSEFSDTDTLLRAISFAAGAHQGQFRKDNRTPYVAHPLRVMTVLVTVFEVRDLDLLVTAVLHDTIEDTTTDRDSVEHQFGSRVSQYVALLSKDKRQLEEERERAYFAGLAAAPVGVKLCKLADVYDNLLDSLSLALETRRKKLQQARELLHLFHEDLADDWPHVLRRVEEQIQRAGTMS